MDFKLDSQFLENQLIINDTTCFDYKRMCKFKMF